ncbi:acylphosphatase [Planktothrix serta]|nr:acylphosphatase [Planktothrix serta]
MSSESIIVRAHVFVSGQVQGVGYRYYTQKQATHRGIQGWVRNLADGRVEAVFEGNRNTVDGMIQWCYHGPKSAHPRDVIVHFEEPEGLQGFEIQYKKGC